MTWSYNPSALTTNSKDQVRLLIGDTFSGDPQLQDEEIAYLASLSGNVYSAAAACCRALVSKFSRAVDQQSSASKVSYSQMAKAYRAAAVAFEAKATILAVPYGGGISISDMQMAALDTDRIQPQFTLGITDNFIPEPSSGPQELTTSGGALRP